jgi:hypothetical protein
MNGIPTATLSIEQALGQTQTVEARAFAETQAALDYQQALNAAQTATAEAPTLQAQFEGTLIAAGTATRQYYLAQTPSSTLTPPLTPPLPPQARRRLPRRSPPLPARL